MKLKALLLFALSLFAFACGSNTNTGQNEETVDPITIENTETLENTADELDQEGAELDSLLNDLEE